jgi:hypothetical protein
LEDARAKLRFVIGHRLFEYRGRLAVVNRIGAEDVRIAQPLRDPPLQIGNRRCIGDVRLFRDRPDALASELVEQPGGHLVVVAVLQRDAGAAVSEGTGDDSPQLASCAGDEGDSAGEIDFECHGKVASLRSAVQKELAGK